MDFQQTKMAAGSPCGWSQRRLSARGGDRALGVAGMSKLDTGWVWTAGREDGDENLTHRNGSNEHWDLTNRN